jgi:hypothetical protein
MCTCNNMCVLGASPFGAHLARVTPYNMQGRNSSLIVQLKCSLPSDKKLSSMRERLHATPFYASSSSSSVTAESRIVTGGVDDIQRRAVKAEATGVGAARGKEGVYCAVHYSPHCAPPRRLVRGHSLRARGKKGIKFGGPGIGGEGGEEAW